LVLKRFIELHTEEDKVQGLKNSIEELTEARGFFGKLPDRSLLEIIADKGRSVTSASDKLEVANGELANAEASPCGDRNLASIHEKIEADGGNNAVVGKARLLLKKQRGASAASVFLYIFVCISEQNYSDRFLLTSFARKNPSWNSSPGNI
jgi:hypothetical protein